MIRVFLLFCVTAYVASEPIEKCKITERSCVVKAANIVYTMVGNIENSGLDPMYIGVIEGNPGQLHYKFTDAVVRGYKNCTIDDAGIDMNSLQFDYELLCSRLTLEGKYNVTGELLKVPVEGSGDFLIEGSKYRIRLHTTIELEGTDSKTYMQIKSFTFDAVPLGPIHFKLDNLFGGNKELADVTLKFVNENWKLVATAVQDPFFQIQLNNLTALANKYFRLIHLQEYFIL